MVATTSSTTRGIRAARQPAAASSQPPAAAPPTEPTPPAETNPADVYEPATVRKAERLLKGAGFKPGKVDGKYTRLTQDALKEFQTSMGLTADGRITSATLNKLGKVNERARTAKREHNGKVGRGQKGEHIEKLEQRMRRLGYDVGKVDGVFDGQTADAVKAFKRDQPELRRQAKSGLLGNNSRSVLRHETAALNHAPHRARVKPSDARRRSDRIVERAAAQQHADGSGGLGRGDKSRAVQVVQGHLKAAGFDPQRKDGMFDDRTEGMVKEFQRKTGLEVSGRVDAATWNRLSRATLEAKSATSPHQRIGEHSAAVKRTEQLLKKVGFHPGKVDGLYTEGTQRALDRFRQKHHLDGKGNGVGQATLKALKRVEKAQRDPIHGLPVRAATGYVNGVSRNIKVVPIEGELVEKDTARAYLKMKAAARKDGVNIALISGFRTMSEQQYLYNGWVNRLPGFNPAAPPGYSNHQSGIALDLNTQGVSRSQGTGAVYNWLARNGHRFGFSRIPSEHWHWEYRG
ncbi:MAG: peptidoglycan-binding protein [Pseudomonadota bacterium]